MISSTSPVLDPGVAKRTPPGFHLLAKPSGSACNIECKHSFFLSKEAVYPGDTRSMSDATLEVYVRQLLESHQMPEVTVAWRGREPTLMGVEFFRRSVELVEKYRRPGQRVSYAFQTDGNALNDEWCSFMKANDFLVDLRVDGPQDLHDTYRETRGSKGKFDLTMRGWQHLRRHGVDCNILCTVNAVNQAHGRRVYRFFRDDLGATWIQFIPIVERAAAATIGFANIGWNGRPRQKRELYTQTGTLVTDRSVRGAQYGQFLVDVFEDWVRHDVGRIFVQLFDVTLEEYFGRYKLCIHAPTCGNDPVMEHNGDLYACDHFVEPDHKLGNIHRTHMLELVASAGQSKFGHNKRDTLTQQCRQCEVLPLCNGGCPKDRFATSRDGEPGHNYLCAGLYRFFTHTHRAMLQMALLHSQDKAPAEMMARVREEDRKRDAYAGCPCGSGRRFRFCHGGQDAVRSPSEEC